VQPSLVRPQVAQRLLSLQHRLSLLEPATDSYRMVLVLAPETRSRDSSKLARLNKDSNRPDKLSKDSNKPVRLSSRLLPRKRRLPLRAKLLKDKPASNRVLLPLSRPPRARLVSSKAPPQPRHSRAQHLLSSNKVNRHKLVPPQDLLPKDRRVRDRLLPRPRVKARLPKVKRPVVLPRDKLVVLPRVRPTSKRVNGLEAPCAGHEWLML
jgi:hypothetical protein